MTADQLEAEFLHRTLRPGSVLILSPVDALALIARAETERLPVLGVDGFHVLGTSIQPDIGESIDFSASGSAPRGVWALAKEFVHAHAENVSGFEVVLGCHPVAAA